MYVTRRLPCWRVFKHVRHNPRLTIILNNKYIIQCGRFKIKQKRIYTLKLLQYAISENHVSRIKE